jgi:hypothetical protein
VKRELALSVRDDDAVWAVIEDGIQEPAFIPCEGLKPLQFTSLMPSSRFSGMTEYT